jgi:hypothetical protein
MKYSCYLAIEGNGLFISLGLLNFAIFLNLLFYDIENLFTELYMNIFDFPNDMN